MERRKIRAQFLLEAKIVNQPLDEVLVLVVHLDDDARGDECCCCSR